MAKTLQAFWFIENDRGEIIAMVSKDKFPEQLNNVIVGALSEMLKEKLTVQIYNMIVNE